MADRLSLQLRPAEGVEVVGVLPPSPLRVRGEGARLPLGDVFQDEARLIAVELVLNDVVGGPIGAFLFAAVAFLPFGVDAATFLLGALLIAVIRTPMQGERQASSQTIRGDIAEGFRFVWQRPFLRGLAIAVALANVSLGAGSAILVLFVIEELGASEAGYGLLVGIGATGHSHRSGWPRLTGSQARQRSEGIDPASAA